jgi:hypothetical protein
MAVPGSRGFATMAATVEEVNGPLVVVIDQFGKKRILRSDLSHGGRAPRLGESWVIEKIGGYWAFQTPLVAQPPTVTTMADLLQALSDAGIVVVDPSFRTSGGGTFYG